jgi:hypothetical protein
MTEHAGKKFSPGALLWVTLSWARKKGDKSVSGGAEKRKGS